MKAKVIFQDEREAILEVAEIDLPSWVFMRAADNVSVARAWVELPDDERAVIRVELT